MNDKIAWRLLWILVAATVIVFALQYAFDHRLEAGVLTYLIPGCTVSYLCGRHDGFRERLARKDKNKELGGGNSHNVE